MPCPTGSSQSQLPESDRSSSDHLKCQLVPEQEAYPEQWVGFRDIDRSQAPCACPGDGRLVAIASRCEFMAPTIMSNGGGSAAWTEAAGMGGTDQAEPDLGCRIAGEQSVRGDDLVRVALEGAGLNVDGHELAGILGTEARSDLALIDIVASSGKLLLGVPRGNSHGAILHYWAR
jgi:hypothetical protein